MIWFTTKPIWHTTQKTATKMGHKFWKMEKIFHESCENDKTISGLFIRRRNVEVVLLISVFFYMLISCLNLLGLIEPSTIPVVALNNLLGYEILHTQIVNFSFSFPTFSGFMKSISSFFSPSQALSLSDNLFFLWC